MPDLEFSLWMCFNDALRTRFVCVHAQATITVEALHDGIDFSLALTRAKFEELNQDLFKKTLDVCMYA